jgi:purine-binding chemotaxis protein CheW
MPRGSRKKEDSEVAAENPRSGDFPLSDENAAEGEETAVPVEEAAEDGGDEQRIELLGFMLSNEEYALDILEIKEIIRPQIVTVVPRTPDFLKGIITLRGVIVPVFDLRRRLGLEEAPQGQGTRIVVVYRGDEYAGLIVDSITQVMRVGLDSIEPTPPTVGVVEAEFIKGVTRHQDRLVILLNLNRVLDTSSESGKGKPRNGE